ncbi:hypothetical protein [Hansschlegelia sp.]
MNNLLAVAQSLAGQTTTERGPRRNMEISFGAASAR